jgi:antitoxin ParD1/3/4
MTIDVEAFMATVRKTITLTDQQSDWVKAQIAEGGFTNDSEYIRDLIRKDQERARKIDALQAAINDGLQSGSAGELNMEYIKKKARQEAEQNGKILKST